MIPNQIKARIEEAGFKHAKETNGYPDELSVVGMFYEAINIITELDDRVKVLENKNKSDYERIVQV